MRDFKEGEERVAPENKRKGRRGWQSDAPGELEGKEVTSW
jgi:hypothetical protein